MRLLPTRYALGVSVAAYALAAASTAYAQSKFFDVPSQPAVTGIPEFARQSDVQILVRESAVRGKSTNAVRGSMTVNAALKRLLDGINVKISHTSGNTYILSAADLALPTVIRTAQYQPRTEATDGLAPGIGKAARGAIGSGQLEDIIVTAQKRTENLQVVPITVSTISPTQLKANAVVDTLGLSVLVPGLSIAVQAGAFLPHIRGIGTNAIGPGLENPVAIYVDGVYIASQAAANSGMVDVAQVSVLKGPQGTLFGRNATGGVIQLNTRDPAADFGGELRTELDNYLTSRSNLYFTGGITDSLKANFSVSYATQGEGWGKNVGTGNDNHRIFHDISLRSKWYFTPSDNTIFKLNLDYMDKAGNSSPNLRPASGTQPKVPAFPSLSNPYDTATALDSLAKVNSKGVSFEIDHDLGFARIVSISAHRKHEFFVRLDSSMQPIQQTYITNPQSGNQFTQEIQLISKDDPVFSWVMGLYYFRSNDKYDPYYDQETIGFSAAPFTRRQVLGSSDMTTDSKAVFGQAKLLVFPETHLTLGLRYTEEKRSIDGRIFGTFYAPFGNLNLAPLFPPLVASQKFSKLTYRIALDHSFTPGILGYASYNRGFKSGGFNPNTPSSNNPSYQPEEVNSYEAGLKMELLDDRLRLNTAFFYNDYTNVQILNFVSLPIITNAASATTYGVDVDLEAYVSDEVRFSGGFEWLRSKFTGNSIGTLATPRPTGGSVGVLGPISGNPLSYAPKFSGYIGVNYTNSYDFGTIDINLTNSYNSGYYGAEDKNPLLKQKSYNYINLAGTWTSNNGKVSVGLWGKNLLDKAVATQLANASQGFTADYSNPPRTIGGTMTFHFGAGQLKSAR